MLLNCCNLFLLSLFCIFAIIKVNIGTFAHDLQWIMHLAKWCILSIVRPLISWSMLCATITNGVRIIIWRWISKSNIISNCHQLFKIQTHICRFVKGVCLYLSIYLAIGKSNQVSRFIVYKISIDVYVHGINYMC